MKGKNALATSTENTFPKFELAVILIYLIIFPKTLLPSLTPSTKTIKLFSSNIISADSLAISTPVSTEIPTSASLRAAASFIPSPIKPTT